MIIEYKGIAERQVGRGTVHEVRAWWNLNQDTEDAVKRAARSAVRPYTETTDHLTVDPLSPCTYSTPQLNDMVRVRVISHERHTELKRLKTVRVTACGQCGDPHPDSYLLLTNGQETGACYTCVRALSARGEIDRNMAWVKADGRLQI